MGSPLRLLIINVFVIKREDGALQSTTGKLPAYYRHVDDIFVLVGHDARIEALLDKFNQAQGELSFTLEEEWENPFHSLDVKLTKTMDGKFTRRVYRKPA